MYVHLKKKKKSWFWFLKTSPNCGKSATFKKKRGGVWWRKRRLLWKTLRWLREIFRPCTVDLRSEKSAIYGISTGWRLKCKIEINVFKKKINGPAGRVNTKNFKFVDFLGRRGNICLIHKYTSYYFFHFCPLYSLACHHETMKLEATVVAHWGWGYHHFLASFLLLL